jgi:hypothetical protein
VILSNSRKFKHAITSNSRNCSKSTINALQNFLYFLSTTFTMDRNFQEPCLKRRKKKHHKRKTKKKATFHKGKKKLQCYNVCVNVTFHKGMI